MHLYPHSSDIQDMTIVLLLGLYLMSHASIAVVLAREGNLSQPMTQRKRYFWVLAGVVPTFSWLIVILSTYGPETVYNEVVSWPHRYDGVGYVGAFVVMLAAGSPIWALIDAFHIYRNPSIRAKLVRFGPREKRGYYFTQDIRTHKLPRLYRRNPQIGRNVLEPAEPLPNISLFNNQRWYRA
jgi:hypothetical protein